MDAPDLMQNVWKLLAVLVLVLLNGFFVAAELALVRIRETQLTALVAKGNRRAKRALHISANVDAYIGATQFGITLASMGLGVAVEPVFKELLTPLFHFAGIASETLQHNIAIGVGFFVNCFLLIVVGELAPKAIAIRRTLPTALWSAEPLHWFFCISYPFIWVLNHSSQWILRRLGIEVSELHGGHSEEELRLLLTASHAASGKTNFSRDLVLNALDLRLRVARDVMRPRKEITALDTQASIAECLEVAEKSRYSRFPVCEDGNLDRTLGVIHIKDLFAMRHSAKVGSELAPALRKIIYIPETARLEKVLQLFLDRKLHLAIVVDEYGGTVGLVTLENIMEELVGQIQDEFDQETPLLTRASETSWEVSGALPLHQLEELVNASLVAEGVTTTSGWVTHKLGGFPKVGDTVSVGRHDLRVEEMEGTRVARLRVSKKPSPDTSAQL